MVEYPNIVLITVDSLRADHCGFMDYEKDTTPTLDSIADEGRVFENAFAPGPSTPESMPATFTGQYPVERETDRNSELAARRERIRAHMEARDTLPEKLSRLGYTTGAFTPNPFTSRYFGFDKGFDHFQDFMDVSQRGGLYHRVFDEFLDGSRAASLARVLLNVWHREEVFKPWERYFDEVVEWARSVADPYFLWVFLMDAHNPYMAGGEYRSQSWWKSFQANYRFWRKSHETPFSETVHERLLTAYDDAIRYSDAFVKRSLDALGGPDTTFVIHGDHGEAFGEYGHYGHEPYLYRENVHVPLIVTDGASERCPEPVSLTALPELVTDVATRDGLLNVNRNYAVCSTRQGSKTALHTTNHTYIASDNGAKVVGQDILKDDRDEQFRTISQQALDKWEHGITEKSRLTDSVASFTAERTV